MGPGCRVEGLVFRIQNLEGQALQHGIFSQGHATHRLVAALKCKLVGLGCIGFWMEGSGFRGLRATHHFPDDADSGSRLMSGIASAL